MMPTAPRVPCGPSLRIAICAFACQIAASSEVAAELKPHIEFESLIEHYKITSVSEMRQEFSNRATTDFTRRSQALSYAISGRNISTVDVLFLYGVIHQGTKPIGSYSQRSILKFIISNHLQNKTSEEILLALRSAHWQVDLGDIEVAIRE